MDGNRHLGAWAYGLAAAAAAAGWMMVATLQPQAAEDAGVLPLETLAAGLPPSPEHAFAVRDGEVDLGRAEDEAAVCRSVAAC